MPFVPPLRLTPAKFIGIALAEFQCPLADRLVCDDDATAGHQLFYVAKTQREPEVEPYDMTDDFCRVAEAAVESGFFHPVTLQNFPGTRKLTVPSQVEFRAFSKTKCNTFYCKVPPWRKSTNI